VKTRLGILVPLLLVPLLLVTACGAPAQTPQPTFPQGPEETPIQTPEPADSPTPEPRPTADAFLHVDGMATITRDMDQIADPQHPNHTKENRKLGPLEAGTPVYLTDMTRVKKTNWWQVYDGSRQDGLLGWIPQLTNEELNLEAYQPECPTEFPLTEESFAGLRMNGSMLTCFGETELTLTGTVTCTRPAVDYTISGASFIDARRICVLGPEDGLRLYGNEITELLESPPLDEVTGRYLVRGHFDDAEAQNCEAIPFGTPPSPVPIGPPDPGAVMACRQMFVVSNAITQQ